MSGTSVGFIRKRFLVRGNLHGSGFPAAVFRLVRSLNLHGWMRPYSRGFEIQLEADEGTLRGFESQLLSRFQQGYYRFSVEIGYMDSKGDVSFRLLDAEEVQPHGRWVLPDTAQCSDCITEMLNPLNRRFFYPHTFCADCGPKYSIARKGLLSREDTLLGEFSLCEQCLAEVGNSRDRRFLHALNTCPICGPGVELWDHRGVVINRQREALIQAAAVLEQGRVLAVKEASGFVLVALAASTDPLRRIRAFMGESHQPIPLMLSSPDALDAFTVISAKEREWVMQPMAPLVRAKIREGSLSLSDQMAPHGVHLDICLPGSGMFHLLMNLLNLPLAVISDMGHRLPYACNEKEALEVFEGLVDFMLISDLPILRSTPRTLIQQVGQDMQILKHGTGLVPVKVALPEPSSGLMALGGKNATALGVNVDEYSFLLGPMGKLGEGLSLDFFFDGLQDVKELFNFKPESLKADMDPNGLTTQYALSTGMKVQQIEHDLAHVMISFPNDFDASDVLGFCFDEGVGRDKKGTVSGGECLWINGTAWQHIAGFGSFWLPGGESAIGDNRACLFGVLREVFGKEMWDALPLRMRAQLNLQEMERWDQVFDSKLQCRRSRSVTHWWLGLAALLTGSKRNRYQGDSFSSFEAILDREIEPSRSVKPYSHPLSETDDGSRNLTLDWIPMMREIVTDLQQGRHSEYILRRVFQTFAQWVLKIAATFHPKCVVLSGSAFENRAWTEHLMEMLHQHGFKTLLTNRAPTNDNGLAIGQLLAASRGMDQQPFEIPSIAKAISKLSIQTTHINRAKGAAPEAT
jgi:hydrogenase maturation protein HypF